MKKVLAYLSLFAVVSVIVSGCGHYGKKAKGIAAAEEVIRNTAGPVENIRIELIDNGSDKDSYSIEASGGILEIKGTSPTAICYAFDRYLRDACGSMVTWGGKNLNIPSVWPDYEAYAESPYKFRYFLNVCTFGYTTPYWDWERWSEEIDWMALHGVNMPLASVASEAIARRVWLRLGLTEEEADAFFTGPAHLPWHRMGNLNSFDGPLNAEWHKGQIELQHKILDKMRALGMEPVAPAFAGFIPPAFMEKNPSVKATQLEWGGFEKKDNACVLAPDSPCFNEIGRMFVEEWQKEFGKAAYWLSDSFNEMKLPVEEGDTEGKHEILKKYGEAIFSSIAAGNPDAVWVTQGWTFGYQHDFWDPESLKALLSGVPDDRMIIVDLGNDYPKWVWNTGQTWKVQDGFHGKQWIYSYVPNFGGKVLPTGDLAMYASGSAEALASEHADGLVGFGSAPEGIENNEVVYELLADMGWTSGSIDLEQWLPDYCRARYGFCDDRMTEAWNIFRGTVYSSLYSYPRFLWQTVVPDTRRKSRHDIGDEYGRAVKIFLECADSCMDSPLYINDAVEFAALWLGEIADRHYKDALAALEKGNRAIADRELSKVAEILAGADRLLASHPDYRLSSWVSFAKAAGADAADAMRFESNAKRLITTWGGWQEDYAARFWSGLISDYYIPRIEIYFSKGMDEMDRWEEEWIQSSYTSEERPFENPVEAALNLLKLYSDEIR
ncbi:MAG: alpha-N-acetylglucosaminidase [Bacteroidales bacterium]|nr:alpha-N-acetylglucosaminidase [Bacteroidales bacterium]